MTNSNDTQRMILRNLLLGRWAAEKLGITGRDAESYSVALARRTVEPGRSDVLTRIRNDFRAAGVTQSDEQMASIMTELTLKAGNLMPTARGDVSDAAAVMLARSLMSR